MALGNGLMNDSWFSQTVDPFQKGQTSLKNFRWLRENKIALGRAQRMSVGGKDMNVRGRAGFVPGRKGAEKQKGRRGGGL